MQLTSCCFQCQTEKPSSKLAIPAAGRKYLAFCVIGLGEIELGDRLLVYSAKGHESWLAQRVG